MINESYNFGYDNKYNKSTNMTPTKYHIKGLVRYVCPKPNTKPKSNTTYHNHTCGGFKCMMMVHTSKFQVWGSWHLCRLDTMVEGAPIKTSSS